MSNHIPGPWKVVGHKFVENDEGRLICNAISLKGASLIECEKRELEAQANARLIAAAPDMLKGLELAVGALKQYWEYGEAMREYGKGFQATYKGYSDYNLKCLESILERVKGES